MPQLCFAVKLRKCFARYETSPCFPPVCRKWQCFPFWVNFSFNPLRWKKIQTYWVYWGTRAPAHTYIHSFTYALEKPTVAQSVSVLRGPGRFPNELSIFFIKKNLVKTKPGRASTYSTTRKLSVRCELSRRPLWKIKTLHTTWSLVTHTHSFTLR